MLDSTDNGRTGTNSSPGLRGLRTRGESVMKGIVRKVLTGLSTEEGRQYRASSIIPVKFEECLRKMPS